MNIFVPYNDPRLCAQALDDKRVVKMVLETAQMLSTAVGGPYKPTHANHPCTRWVGETKVNYEWALGLFLCLCNEYRHRFGREHACQRHSQTFMQSRSQLPPGPRTPFPNCSGVQDQNVHDAYRECLKGKWAADKRAPRWTKRTPPEWAFSLGEPA